MVFTVLPENAPPVKFAALTHPAAVENPVPAVIVVPVIVPPVNALPEKLGAIIAAPAVIPLVNVLVPTPERYTFPVITKSPKFVTVGILKNTHIIFI